MSVVANIGDMNAGDSDRSGSGWLGLGARAAMLGLNHEGRVF